MDQVFEVLQTICTVIGVITLFCFIGLAVILLVTRNEQL